MDFAGTAIRLTAIASLTQELNIGYLITPATRKRHDMIIFQRQRTTATFTCTSISGKNYLFSGLGDVPTLTKAGYAYKEKGKE
jgi:hypothetical protein